MTKKSLTNNAGEIDKKAMEKIAQELMTPAKGILAADESNETVGKRLAEVGVENSEENRRRYRDLLLATPDLTDFVSGVILYDETFWQESLDGVPFPKLLAESGILPGIKVDLGARDFPGHPGEKLTVGLDDLQSRVERYRAADARFAKWRAVIAIDQTAAPQALPTDEAINQNADALARYAKICQDFGLVPIVEPEVLIEGSHSIDTAGEVTTRVVQKLFEKLVEYGVHLPALILKTSMVIQGDKNPDEASPPEVANATIKMLRTAVPSEVGGVVFLSGGQTAVEASAHLDAIAEKEEALPFEIAFSYSRALQNPVLRTWKGQDENVEIARAEFLRRLKFNQLADLGDYDVSMEFTDH